MPHVQLTPEFCNSKFLILKLFNSSQLRVFNTVIAQDVSANLFIIRHINIVGETTALSHNVVPPVHKFS